MNDVVSQCLERNRSAAQIRFRPFVEYNVIDGQSGTSTTTYPSLSESDPTTSYESRKLPVANNKVTSGPQNEPRSTSNPPSISSSTNVSNESLEIRDYHQQIRQRYAETNDSANDFITPATWSGEYVPPSTSADLELENLLRRVKALTTSSYATFNEPAVLPPHADAHHNQRNWLENEIYMPPPHRPGYENFSTDRSVSEGASYPYHTEQVRMYSTNGDSYNYPSSVDYFSAANSHYYPESQFDPFLATPYMNRPPPMPSVSMQPEAASGFQYQLSNYWNPNSLPSSIGMPNYGYNYEYAGAAAETGFFIPDGTSWHHANLPPGNIPITPPLRSNQVDMSANSLQIGQFPDTFSYSHHPYIPDTSASAEFYTYASTMANQHLTTEFAAVAAAQNATERRRLMNSVEDRVPQNVTEDKAQSAGPQAESKLVQNVDFKQQFDGHSDAGIDPQREVSVPPSDSSDGVPPNPFLNAQIPEWLAVYALAPLEFDVELCEAWALFDLEELERFDKLLLRLFHSDLQTIVEKYERTRQLLSEAIETKRCEESDSDAALAQSGSRKSSLSVAMTQNVELRL